MKAESIVYVGYELLNSIFEENAFAFF